MTLGRYEGTMPDGGKVYARAASCKDAADAFAGWVDPPPIRIDELPGTDKVGSRVDTVQINAPDWYRRPDFVTWLRGERDARDVPPATWHDRGREPDENSDVFVTVDLGSPTMPCGEGSDSNMPPDIWDELCQVVEAAGVRQGLVWITNLDADSLRSRGDDEW